MTTPIKAQYSVRPGRILGSRMCEEAPLKDEFDLIEAKGRGVNEQVNVRIQIKDLDEDEI